MGPRPRVPQVALGLCWAALPFKAKLSFFQNISLVTIYSQLRLSVSIKLSRLMLNFHYF